MSQDNVSEESFELPAGYAAVAVSVEQTAAPMRICVVAKTQPDPAAGYFVCLRESIDAHVLLGALCDAAGKVHRWLELWVQTLDNLAAAVATYTEALSNKVLDDRWRRHAAALEESDAAELIATGWETAHPLPVWLDMANLLPVQPRPDASAEPWKLCVDDALLTQNGLPAYSTSLHRYLCGPLAGGIIFVPTTADAPTNEHTRPLAETAGKPGLLPLNPAGGLMLVRGHSPLSYERFVECLGGQAWDGPAHGRSVVKLGGAVEAATGGTGAPDEGRLFLGTHGRWGRLVETFHLKLRLLADAVAAVQVLTAKRQAPLLNLSAESFEVSLGQPGRGLPVLWTAKARLVEPGDAVALPVQAADAQYFVRPGRAHTSIYRPAAAGVPVAGRSAVRIRQTLPESGDRAILEGTFSTQERIEPARNDVVWLRLNLACGRVDLYARLESQTAMAAGEWRFRTVAQKFTSKQLEHLRSAEGVPFADTMFELVPLLSTPCDLYALGVLAVRTLLVDPQTTLAMVLDEVLSLARQAATDAADGMDLPQRIRAVFSRDGRWLTLLGPHRLVHQEMKPEEAFDLVPQDLWFDTLAMIVRTLPGIGPDIAARDYGDAPSRAVQKVFDRAAADLESLLRRTLQPDRDRLELQPRDPRGHPQVFHGSRRESNVRRTIGLVAVTGPGAQGYQGKQTWEPRRWD